MKNSTKWFAIALLVAFVLLVSLLPQTNPAKAATARPTCGATVFGHTTGGGHRETCPDNGKILFSSGDHVYSQGVDVCPLDGTPMINGHSLAGGD